MGVMAHIMAQSPLKGVHRVVYVKSDQSSCVTNGKRVQTLLTFTPPVNHCKLLDAALQ